MTGQSWLVDSNRIATKIKSASGLCDPGGANWKSNPTRSCPNCQYTIDNRDVTQDWPGLPRGVKFDPSDQEIIWHLLGKVSVGSMTSHPFIDEFIPTVIEEDGICYTHPQNLPGVKQDGGVSHFFHRAVKAYNTGTRKRRKIHGDDFGDVRWHKTGRTKPVILDGVQKGCKKIMVLYLTPVRGGKAKKTNWVMHQYHLGTGEDEKEGQFVVSKVFYQQQQAKPVENFEQDLTIGTGVMIKKVDPITPHSVTRELSSTERGFTDLDPGQEPTISITDPPSAQPQLQQMGHAEDEVQVVCGEPDEDSITAENHVDITADNNDVDITADNNDNPTGEEDPKWWDSESQNLLDSQQLVEALSLCDDLLRSQSPIRDENDHGELKGCLSDYARLGPEHLKKDLEECQNLDLDPANIDLDTPPDFRLSQLEFGSQESYLAWGGYKVID